jgi:pimeloyl-ACP methyl ester carboxylesterase
MASTKRILGAIGLSGLALAGGYALARSAAKRREDVDLESADVPGSFVEIDGQRVHYVESGRGEPVLLIHGWNGSTFDMRYTIPELAQRYRVIALDLLGYGFSARPASGDYSAGGLASFADRVMDRLQIDRAVVLGHSMGGAIAMRLAVSYPRRVDRLVLVASATGDEMRRGRTAGMLIRPLLPVLTSLFLRRGIVRRALLGVVHDPALVTPEFVEGHFRPMRVKGHLRAQSKQLSDRRKDPPLDASQITQRTFIMWGEHDRVIPLSTGLRLAEEIPRANIAIIRSAGHLPLEEQPDECNKLLLQFLAQQPAAETPAVPSNGVAHESASPVS